MLTVTTRKSQKKYISPYNRFIGSMVPNWLMRRGEISQGAKLCYGRLCQFAGKDGKCYPSKRVIGKELGVSDRTAYTYIKELENCGLIEVKRNRQSRRVNHYKFLDHEWITDGSLKKPSSKTGKKSSYKEIKKETDISFDVPDNIDELNLSLRARSVFVTWQHCYKYLSKDILDKGKSWLYHNPPTLEETGDLTDAIGYCFVNTPKPEPLDVFINYKKYAEAFDRIKSTL